MTTRNSRLDLRGRAMVLLVAATMSWFLIGCKKKKGGAPMAALPPMAAQKAGVEPQLPAGGAQPAAAAQGPIASVASGPATAASTDSTDATSSSTDVADGPIPAEFRESPIVLDISATVSCSESGTCTVSAVLTRVTTGTEAGS